MNFRNPFTASNSNVPWLLTGEVYAIHHLRFTPVLAVLHRSVGMVWLSRERRSGRGRWEFTRLKRWEFAVESALGSFSNPFVPIANASSSPFQSIRWKRREFTITHLTLASSTGVVIIQWRWRAEVLRECFNRRRARRIGG